MNSIDHNLRLAKPDDLAAILQVQASSAEAPRWSEAVWHDLLAAATSLPRLALVADDGDGLCGFLVASCAAGVAEIESIAVMAASRRQGIGCAMCAQAIEWARMRSASAIQLEVRADGGAAQALYRSLGFAEQGRRRNYYVNPVDDALLMLLPL